MEYSSLNSAFIDIPTLAVLSIKKRYTEPHRMYHTLTHIHDMMKIAFEVDNQINEGYFITMTSCFYCQNEFDQHELRPYGPNGTCVCFNCAFATPDREEQTKKMFNQQFDSALSVSNSIVIGEHTGPRPLYNPTKGN